MHELFTMFNTMNEEQTMILASQEHHLLTYFPQTITLIRPRLSAVENEIMRSIETEAVADHLNFCEDAHGLPSQWHEPLLTAKTYKEWHVRLASRLPIPLALGAISVMYGQRREYLARFEALLEPYQTRIDLIEAGAQSSRALTLRMWNQVVALMKEVRHELA